MAPTLNPPPNTTTAITAIERTLKQQYRIEILDSRVFTGQLVCLDKQGNIILDYATETPPPIGNTGDGESRAGEAREVGLVMIPKRHWKSIAIERSLKGVYSG